MSAAKHTPERWECDVSDDGYQISGPDGHVFIIVRTSDGESLSEENRANAFRLVAAVNACAGIPTSQLEGAKLAVLVRALRDIRDYLHVSEREIDGSGTAVRRRSDDDSWERRHAAAALRAAGMEDSDGK